MKNTVAIMQRELLSLFCSPIAYVVIAAFLVVTGVLVLVMDNFAPGKPANLRGVFQWTPFLLTIIIPAITMRMISEELRNGTLETLVTAPVTDAQIVFGKYLAGVVFYAVMLATTLVYIVMMMIFGNPDVGAAIAGYLGLFLVGLPFIAFGLLTSSITKNQIVAWILGMVPLMLFAWFAAFMVGRVEGWMRTVFREVNVMQRFDMFNRGLVTTDSIVFFVGAAGLFLFCTIKMVESRRWR